jgi:hypothetical protein
MTILLDFNAKVWWEDIFTPAIGNEGLHEINNDKGVRVVNLHLKISHSKVQHSNIITFLNLFGSLLMEEHKSQLACILKDR